MSAVLSRPATREDIRKLCGDIPDTFRALAFELNGQLVGVGGVWYKEGRAIVFSAYDEVAEDHPWLKAKAVILVMNLAKARPCFAFASDHPKSAKTLEHFGFTHIEGNAYGWG